MAEPIEVTRECPHCHKPTTHRITKPSSVQCRQCGHGGVWIGKGLIEQARRTRQGSGRGGRPAAAAADIAQWAAPARREPDAEPCPVCDGPAARTPQGTLTDCPSCGLVLTAGCRLRLTAGEDAARRSVPEPAAAGPSMTDRLMRGMADRQLDREQEQVAALYEDWAIAMDPAGLAPPLDRMCAGLCDGFATAAEMARATVDLAELTELRVRIGRQLIRHATALEDRVMLARGQEPDADDIYDDDDDQDDEAAAVTAAPERRALTPDPAPSLAPVCERCGREPAGGRIDAGASPGIPATAGRAVLGLTGPANVCKGCGEALAAAADRMGITLFILAEYRTGIRVVPAIRVPSVPAFGTSPISTGPVLPGLPRARPLAVARPAVARPDPAKLAAGWAAYQQQKKARPRCDVRAGHKIGVVTLGNAAPIATVKITGTGPNEPRSLFACGEKCATRAAGLLNAAGHDEIVTEPIQ